MSSSHCHQLKMVEAPLGGRFELRHSLDVILHIVMAGLIMTGGSSCNSQPASANAEADISRIKPLTALYTSYINRNGAPPPNEAEFKRYIAETGEPVLKSMGITADEMFISPRDNQPYVVLYGSEAAKLLNRGVVTYERTGVGGRRLVGYRAGSVNEVDEAQFRNLIPPS